MLAAVPVVGAHDERLAVRAFVDRTFPASDHRPAPLLTPEHRAAIERRYAGEVDTLLGTSGPSGTGDHG